MIGYAYIDMDLNVIYKLASYIETVNPGFFTDNRHLILKHWKFDTEDSRSMIKVFTDLSNMQTPVESVKNFISCIGYDMTKLKDASKV